ncbi:MAG: trigger factor [Fusobacterium sp. JB019]|nr:trigger factor [Fusobacterium sp. JB020]MDP0507499.1 trigger factor [Fusobacterium sp. JB019]
MKHEIKKLEKSALEITMTWDKEEFAPVEKQVLAEIQKNVEVPGFRKGHAPIDQIESKFEKEIKEEITDKLIKTDFVNVIKEEELKPISPLYNAKADKKDGGFEITASIDVFPEFTLGQYKDLEIEKTEFEMSDDKLEAAIAELLKGKAKLEECEEGHKAEMGDTMDLAFEGFVDGVAFEGGKADSHTLELGSHSFIDTFEDQLVGYTVGQEGEVNVTFPEQYHAENLAGKPALFKVKVNAIKKLATPELNDELAKELKYENVEDLKAKLGEETEKKGKEAAEVEFKGRVLQKVMELTEVEVPKSLVMQEVDAKINQFAQQLKSQGMEFEQYLKMTGSTMESIYDQLAPMSENKVKMDLVLDRIAQEEKIEVTEEELTEKAKEFAASYGMTFEDLEAELNKNKKMDEFKGSIKADLVINKAMDFLVANVK